MVVVLSRNDFVRRRDNCVTNFGGKDSQLLVDNCCRTLNLGKRHDLCGFETAPGNGKVLDRTLRLCAIECVGWYSDLAHCVVFDSELAHGFSFSV
jgi:hypothetical protein